MPSLITKENNVVVRVVADVKEFKDTCWIVHQTGGEVLRGFNHLERERQTI